MQPYVIFKADRFERISGTIVFVKSYTRYDIELISNSFGFVGAVSSEVKTLQYMTGTTKL